MPGPVKIVVVAHPVCELLPRKALVSKEEFIVVNGPELHSAFLSKYNIIEADTIPLRINVELSHRAGLIACISKRLSHRGYVGHPKRFLEYPVVVCTR